MCAADMRKASRVQVCLTGSGWRDRQTQLLARVRDVFAAAREERRGTEDERDDSAKAALRSKGPGTSSRYR